MKWKCKSFRRVIKILFKFKNGLILLFLKISRLVILVSLLQTWLPRCFYDNQPNLKFFT